MSIHIGSLIKEIVEKKGINKSEFARRINTTSQNVYGIFKRKSIDTYTLKQISEILEHDFFQYFRDENILNEEISEYSVKPKAISPLIREIEKMKKELEILRQENIYLKEINTLLKSKKKK